MNRKIGTDPIFLILAVVAVIAVALPFVVTSYRTFQLTLVLVYAIALLGLNILTGYNGQISLGHGAFYALGAYASAIMMDQWNVPYGWTIPVAERELAVEAREQIEAENRDGVDDRERNLEDVEILQHERHREHDQEAAAEKEAAPRGQRDAADYAHRGRALDVRRSMHGHTRVTTGRPNSPLGFTHSTATMMISAIESFISRPTTGL